MAFDLYTISAINSHVVKTNKSPGDETQRDPLEDPVYTKISK